ncbi:MAG: hypothetical protein OXC95_18590 [Dehalococcoidia bacterium]|nr:hypothetical protein [Dehalococcoidia bacterium]
MDNTAIVKTLTSVPTAELRIFALVEELTASNGHIDIELAARRQKEIKVACTEAADHASSTNSLLQALQCEIRPRRH